MVWDRNGEFPEYEHATAYISFCGSAFRDFRMPNKGDMYRGIVEEALFDRRGRPSLFFELVEVVMGRIEAGRRP
jgi:hypothetical protein